jgi:micrococcal nuclease
MRSWAVAVLISLALTPAMEAGATCASPTASPELPRATVVRVLDGRTIQVRLGRRIETVRYLGVVTPRPLQQRPDARLALALNRELVEGQAVRLQPPQPSRDRDGRLLAYVYVGDVMVNAEFVCRGYATAATDLPHEPHQTLFRKLEREAREAGRGLWPRVTMRDGLLSVAFNASNAPDALRAIERATGIPIEVPSSLEGQTLTLDIEGRPFEEVLRHTLAVLKVGGMAVVYAPGGRAIRAIVVDSAPGVPTARSGRARARPLQRATVKETK